MSIAPTPSIDSSRRRRRGPIPLPVGELRVHSVSVRLNNAELAQLDEQRVGPRMQRGEYLRCAALHQLPPTIPSINRLAWVDLARASSNLNQISRRQAESERGAPGPVPSVGEVAHELAEFRRALLGASDAGDGNQ